MNINSNEDGEQQHPYMSLYPPMVTDTTYYMNMSSDPEQEEEEVDTEAEAAALMSTMVETTKIIESEEGEEDYTNIYRQVMKDDGIKKVDALLSREILKLNAHDRNMIEEEIDGVQCMAPDETSE